MTNTSPVGRYILKLCQDQNLSMREASIRSGLSPEAIGVIVRRGATSKPRPDTLRLIADGIGGDFNRMMILAGHLPPEPDPDRLEDFNYVTRVLAELPEEYRVTAMDAIQDIAEGARRRALEEQRRKKAQAEGD